MNGSRRGGLLAFAILAISGCAGNGDSGEGLATTDAAPSTDPTVPTPTDIVPDPGTTGFAHHHDYWAGRMSVVVFLREDLPLQTFPVDGLLGNGCNAVGFAEFDFQDDAPGQGGAEVVFPGTDRISVHVDWNANPPDHIEQLAFRYRPANDRFWRTTVVGPQGKVVECGLVVPKDRPFEIPVGALQFDPPHQTNLSRWKFEVWAFSPQTEPVSGASVGAPALAKGVIKVEMRIMKGKDTPLDPPHPDFYGKNDSIALGTAYGNESFAYVADYSWAYTGADRPLATPANYSGENGRNVAFIPLPVGSTVPMGTVRVSVRACIQYAGLPNPSMEYRLAFHGADAKTWKLLTPSSSEAGCEAYEILDPGEVMVDDPYQFTSQWEFRIVPLTAGKPWVGYFAGSYSISFTAHRTLGG